MHKMLVTWGLFNDVVTSSELIVQICAMVVNNEFGNQTFSSPTNALVEFIKTRLKLGRLLQHVSVYKETIIREPVSA